ncbi:MAG: SMP-30/gluconolactonase/LRE family protein [Actinomycetota bacterium]
MSEVREIASGLQFPEGPVAMPDGSVLLTEIRRGTISRVTPDGKVEVVAETGGGPNGLAVGPDAKGYVCNNGSSFEWIDVGDMTIPGPCPDSHTGGSIQRVDLDTGAVETLYTEADGVGLRGPNDLVFDSHGGFWFTDHGTRTERHMDRAGVFYAKPDGSSIREVIPPMDAPNGIGLSPAGDKLYVAETHTGRVWMWDVTGPGEVAFTNPMGAGRGTLLAGLPGYQLLDSLAVDGEGWVCVATIANGGITAISPDGGTIEHTPTPYLLTTNICFGGDDLRTAFITLSATGKLVAIDWPRPGLKLAHV